MIQLPYEVLPMPEKAIPAMYNQVYNEIAEEIGLNAALKIYNMYHGTQINFPQKLHNPDYVKMIVPMEYDGGNVKQLAKKYNYSEKTIRRMIKESVDEE